MGTMPSTDEHFEHIAPKAVVSQCQSQSAAAEMRTSDANPEEFILRILRHSIKAPANNLLETAYTMSIIHLGRRQMDFV